MKHELRCKVCGKFMKNNMPPNTTGTPFPVHSGCMMKYMHKLMSMMRVRKTI